MELIPPYQPTKIYMDSKYMIEWLTTHLENWENNGWIDIKKHRILQESSTPDEAQICKDDPAMD